MAERLFPQLTPTGRKYTPGRIPETIFESQNGASTFVQFGGAFVNAELSLEFRNIRDGDAMQILAHYESVTQDDYVVFLATRGLGGMTPSFIAELETGRGTLKWRYDRPPEIQSVYPGVSSVSCSFTGYLYGA